MHRLRRLREAVIVSLRRILPIRLKRWLVELSVSEEVAGNLYYHVGLLRKLGYEPDLVVDIGAYRGEWTQNVLRVFPDAHFLMVEPQDDKETTLAGFASAHPNVTYRRALVGKESLEEVPFFQMETGSSIYEEETDVPRTLRRYAMTTLDQLLAPFSANEVFLKLDVQGAELDVLQGAPATLQRCSFVLLEASLLSYNRGAPPFSELIGYLSEMGFALFDVCDQRRKPDGTLFQLDLIFARTASSVRKAVEFMRPSSSKVLT